MLRLNFFLLSGQFIECLIQIQPMLRLNWGVRQINRKRVKYSNTTNVKVKLCPSRPENKLLKYSNTTNVKVKRVAKSSLVTLYVHSNTTNVKVKQPRKWEQHKRDSYSNTTNVKVKPKTTVDAVMQTWIFKYNQC